MAQPPYIKPTGTTPGYYDESNAAYLIARNKNDKIARSVVIFLEARTAKEWGLTPRGWRAEPFDDRALMLAFELFCNTRESYLPGVAGVEAGEGREGVEPLRGHEAADGVVTVPHQGFCLDQILQDAWSMIVGCCGPDSNEPLYGLTPFTDGWRRWTGIRG